MKNKSIRYVISGSLFFPLLILLSVAACDSPTDKYEKVLEEKPVESTVVQTEWSSKESDEKTEVRDTVVEKAPSPDTGSLSGRQSKKAEKVYTYQVGAFLNPKNAERLIGKLSSKGYPAHLLVKNTGEKKWNIVRVGPFPDRKTAVEKASTFAQEEKMDIVVMRGNNVINQFKYEPPEKSDPPEESEPMKTERVAKASSRKSATETVPERNIKPEEDTSEKIIKPEEDTSDKPYSFQVGGLYSADVAKKYMRKYQKKGYSPYIIEVKDDITNETWYSVRIGRFKKMQEAVDAAADFAAKEDVPAQARPLRY